MTISLISLTLWQNILKEKKSTVVKYTYKGLDERHCWSLCPSSVVTDCAERECDKAIYRYSEGGSKTTPQRHGQGCRTLATRKCGQWACRRIWIQRKQAMNLKRCVRSHLRFIFKGGEIQKQICIFFFFEIVIFMAIWIWYCFETNTVSTLKK